MGAIGELGLQYQGLTLSSPEAEPYRALAEELDVPVGVHLSPGPPGATYDCCPDFRAAHANPLLIEEALARHPDIQVYIMPQTKAITTHSVTITKSGSSSWIYIGIADIVCSHRNRFFMVIKFNCCFHSP